MSFLYIKSDELSHYGIKGQKWGVRRYQNLDGTRTAEGLRRAKAEYRADNKEAFETGKHATIASRAYGTAQRKALKAEERYNRNPSERNKKNLEMRKELEKSWEDTYKALSQRAEKHCDSLIAKYGKEAVAGINRDKHGRINESTTTIGEEAVSALITLAGTAIVLTGVSPIGVVSVPKSSQQKGNAAYQNSVKAYKNRH